MAEREKIGGLQRALLAKQESTYGEERRTACGEDAVQRGRQSFPDMDEAGGEGGQRPCAQCETLPREVVKAATPRERWRGDCVNFTGMALPLLGRRMLF